MDEDVRIFDTEEVLKQLQALEASILPPDAALVAKNRYAPRQKPNLIPETLIIFSKGKKVCLVCHHTTSRHQPQTAPSLRTSPLIFCAIVWLRPWLASIVEPSQPPPPGQKAPNVNLELAWVHGYNAQNTRNSLAYNNSMHAIYPVGTPSMCFC